MFVEWSGYLTGHLLVAMPHMQDGRFYKSFIFICGHDENGAMGLVLNQKVENLTVHDLLVQMGLPSEVRDRDIPVYAGGPIEGGRGFVLHTPDYQNETTLLIGDKFALTSTVDMLSVMMEEEAPPMILTLGYAGWGPGQLDKEIESNSWLYVEADEELVFQTQADQKWVKALEKIGCQDFMIAREVGHA